MVNRENELPSYPLVEMALEAIADWVSNYRNAIGFKNEFGMCGPDEVIGPQGTRQRKATEEYVNRAAR